MTVAIMVWVLIGFIIANYLGKTRIIYCDVMLGYCIFVSIVRGFIAIAPMLLGIVFGFLTRRIRKLFK